MAVSKEFLLRRSGKRGTLSSTEKGEAKRGRKYGKARGEKKER